MTRDEMHFAVMQGWAAAVRATAIWLSPARDIVAEFGETAIREICASLEKAIAAQKEKEQN